MKCSISFWEIQVTSSRISANIYHLQNQLITIYVFYLYILREIWDMIEFVKISELIETIIGFFLCSAHYKEIFLLP